MIMILYLFLNKKCVRANVWCPDAHIVNGYILLPVHAIVAAQME